PAHAGRLEPDASGLAALSGNGPGRLLSGRVERRTRGHGDDDHLRTATGLDRDGAGRFRLSAAGHRPGVAPTVRRLSPGATGPLYQTRRHSPRPTSLRWPGLQRRMDSDPMGAGPGRPLRSPSLWGD